MVDNESHFNNSDIIDPLSRPASTDMPERVSPQKERMLAFSELQRSIADKRRLVNELWKEANDRSGLTWEEINADPALEAWTGISPGDVQFQPVWHEGAMLGGVRFQLEEIEGPALGSWGDSVDADIERRSIEEMYDYPIQIVTLRVQEKDDSIHEWIFRNTPDGPPHAIDVANAKFFNLAAQNMGVRHRIEAAFGEESVPELSINEMRLLSSAINTTPGDVPGSTQS